jgi:hypothetical protein
VAAPRQRRNIVGLIGVAFALLLVVAALRHNFNAARETRLFNLGADAYFSKPLPGLRDRLARSSIEGVAKNLPTIIDRTFGKIIAVDFGKRFDISQISPDAATGEILENDGIEVILIDGLPLTDAHFIQFAGLTHLRELGLRNTKVTADGIARFHQARPDVSVQQLPDASKEAGSR